MQNRLGDVHNSDFTFWYGTHSGKCSKPKQAGTSRSALAKRVQEMYRVLPDFSSARLKELMALKLRPSACFRLFVENVGPDP